MIGDRHVRLFTGYGHSVYDTGYVLSSRPVGESQGSISLIYIPTRFHGKMCVRPMIMVDPMAKVCLDPWSSECQDKIGAGYLVPLGEHDIKHGRIYALVRSHEINELLNVCSSAYVLTKLINGLFHI